MEYMALKKPIVQFDLKEGKVSAQKASLYAKNNDTIDFAEKIIHLINHPDLREEMASFGYNRVLNELSWSFESKKLIHIYNRVFNLNRGTD
jgi:glycosyltransferase involved in cell wall biosynthesis